MVGRRMQDYKCRWLDKLSQYPSLLCMEIWITSRGDFKALCHSPGLCSKVLEYQRHYARSAAQANNISPQHRPQANSSSTQCLKSGIPSETQLGPRQYDSSKSCTQYMQQNLTISPHFNFRSSQVDSPTELRPRLGADHMSSVTIKGSLG